MNFAFKKGLLWISVSVIYEGQRINVNDCILDTGSATTAIDIDLIPFNYQKPARIKRLYGVGDGTQDVICQRVDGIDIGGVVIPEVELEFGELKGRLGIGGFIGNDILRRFSVGISYSDQILELRMDHGLETFQT